MSLQWPRTRLSEILIPVSRSESVSPSGKYKLLGVRLDGKGAFLREEVIGTQTSAGTLYKVAAGDFVYSRLFACRGAFCIIPPMLDGCYVSGEFPIFVPLKDRIDLRFLNYWFRLQSIMSKVREDCSGSTPLTRNRFKEKFFLGLEIPLPPLEEQRRLVARLEKIVEMIEEAMKLNRMALEEAEHIIKARLEELFGNPYCDKPGSIRNITLMELNDIVKDVSDGPHIKPQYVESGIPFITVQNITSGKIRFENFKCITEEDHIRFQSRARAERGDVLISKDGATRGIPCYVDTDRPFSFFVSVALIKPKGVLDGEYLAWVLRSPYIQKEIFTQSRGDMIPHIVLGRIRKFIIPLPDMNTQRKIVAYLNKLDQTIVALMKIQEEITLNLEFLSVSTFESTFNG